MQGLGQLVGLDLAVGIFVGAGFVIERGDAVFFEAVQPGADGAPGKLIGLAGLSIDKRPPGDLLDARPDSGAGGVIHGAQHSEFEFERGAFLYRERKRPRVLTFGHKSLLFSG